MYRRLGKNWRSAALTLVIIQAIFIGVYWRVFYSYLYMSIGLIKRGHADAWLSLVFFPFWTFYITFLSACSLLYATVIELAKILLWHPFGLLIVYLVILAWCIYQLVKPIGEKAP
jgi:hypothetical protein